MKRIYLTFGLLFIFITGCDAKTDDFLQEPTVQVGAEPIPLYEGSSCKKQNGSMICTDTPAPEELVQDKNAYHISKDNKIEIIISNKQTTEKDKMLDFFFLKNGTEIRTPLNVTVSDNKMIAEVELPKDSDEYVGSIHLKSANGDANYVFKIRIP